MTTDPTLSEIPASLLSELIGQGFKQTEIADLMRVARPSLSMILARKRGITLDHLESMRQSLGLRSSQMFELLRRVALTMEGGVQEHGDPFLASAADIVSRAVRKSEPRRRGRPRRTKEEKLAANS